MGVKKWFMNRNIRNMSKDEKQSMMNKMMDSFFGAMTQDEKKEMLATMMPKMMDRMLGGMTGQERLELMTTMMPIMMGQMFGREGGTPMMAQMMRTMTGGEAEGESPRMSAMKTQEDFKPWECCPCRGLCKEALTSSPTN